MKILLLFLAVAAAAFVISTSRPGNANAMCASISAACGGYPAPPTCSWWNVNSYWYGHWWSWNGAGFNYVAKTYRCTNDFPWLYNAFVQYGIDPHASPGYAWAG